MSQPRQRIRFLKTGDGITLAWAEVGNGPTLVKAANWLTHLEYEWESPVWRHWIRFFASHFRFIRYDERGCGMTDRDVGETPPERWAGDLEDVIGAAAPEDKLILLGISQGAAACVHYAVHHPERVSRMILYGGYARGFFQRHDAEMEREYRAILEVVRVGWGKETSSFRQLFTSRFIPEGTPEQMAWFNELCRQTISPAMAAQLFEARANINITDLLSDVRVPTLVIHARGDGVVPLYEGRLLASGIPDAQFVEIESRNHVLLEGEPGWNQFQEAVLDFVGPVASPVGEDPAFSALSPREREVLVLLSEGLRNAEIGERLAISEKTVRNHISSLYDKLGVWTRGQAIVFARDRGLQSRRPLT
jgi:pimeloyl-ACP methyl ester carboxylesterase/DNA-binding CsgD family transcriptional regulator